MPTTKIALENNLDSGIKRIVIRLIEWLKLQENTSCPWGLNIELLLNFQTRS